MMNYSQFFKLVSMCLLWVSLSLGNRPALGTDVYLVTGQSNAWRMSHLNPGEMKIPGGKKIYYFGMPCVSEPEVANLQVLDSLNPGSMGTPLALELLDKSNSDIVIIQYSRCGAPLLTKSKTSWNSEPNAVGSGKFSNGLFPKFQFYLESCKKQITDKNLAWETKGLFWLQGESDVRTVQDSDHYKKNLTWTLDRFYKSLGGKIPVVVGEIRALNRGARLINIALTDLAASHSNIALATTNDIPNPAGSRDPNNVHFNRKSFDTIAERFVDGLSSLNSPQKQPLSGQASRPNIIVIFADDHAQQAISAYGSKINITPNIDRLAKDGIRFNQSFVCNSICAPSRATFLTGLHSHSNGQTGNRSKFKNHLPTFVKQLKKNNYDTAVVGKWHLSAKPSGFDYWALRKGSIFNGNFETSKGKKKFKGHATDAITNHSLDWVKNRENQNKPFMLWMSHSAAHRTWIPAIRHLGRTHTANVPAPASFHDDYRGKNPGASSAQMKISKDLFPAYDLKLPVTGKGILDRAAKNQLNAMSPQERNAWHNNYKSLNQSYFQKQENGSSTAQLNYQRYIKGYLASVDGLDDSVGKVRRFLKANGLSENTIVIYTSDQGFFLGEHGWYDKRWMYEESLRTPLIVYWPGVTKPGTSVEKIVQNIDLAPTLIDLTNSEKVQSMQGRSLAPLLKGMKVSKWRDAIYYHYQMVEKNTRTAHLVARHYGIRTDRFKLIYFYDSNSWELYDLKNDPIEMVNQYANKNFLPEIHRLKKRLKELRKEFGDSSGKEF